ncbi:uncharacterized protein LOC134766413 [Penaeus indicus]|uniref:uncharacterized protein LOC134766413 n=1 Tax=Penaeus indicus TaxID=29960 RepID=UPI00300CE717
MSFEKNIHELLPPTTTLTPHPTKEPRSSHAADVPTKRAIWGRPQAGGPSDVGRRTIALASRTTRHRGRHQGALVLLVLLLLARPLLGRAGKERLLACVCNTNECQHEGTSTCHTKAHCYSQRWDQRDDSQPVVRGCMTAGSLLCMNQRPRGHNGSWPFLNCCDTYMCNRDVSPTPSPALTLARRQEAVTQSQPNSLERLGVSSVEEFRKKYEQPGPECDQSKLTMLYLGVTGAALILMVIITVVGSFILLSYRRRYIRAPCVPPEAPREKSHHIPLFLQTNA